MHISTILSADSSTEGHLSVITLISSGTISTKGSGDFSLACPVKGPGFPIDFSLACSVKGPGFPIDDRFSILFNETPGWSDVSLFSLPP